MAQITKTELIRNNVTLVTENVQLRLELTQALLTIERMQAEKLAASSIPAWQQERIDAMRRAKEEAMRTGKCVRA